MDKKIWEIRLKPCGADVNVLHILEDFSELAGGIPKVVKELIKYVDNDQIRMKVLYAKGWSSDARACASPPSFIGKSWSWNPSLSKNIRELVTDSSGITGVHIHGIWSGPQLLGGKIARELNLPFIMSSHGMLEPWLWMQQGFKIRLKKSLYWNLFAYPCFMHAKVLHAITPLERDNLHRLFPKSRVEIIPNAINVDKLELAEIKDPRQREKIILFVGRLEPKKGIHLLILAFAKAGISKDWRLIILGPTWSSDYRKYLLKIINEYQLEDRIVFKGAIFDDEKKDWMLRSWVMVSPSYSEAIGLVNLEAAVNRLPAITTYQTGLYNWTEGGGVLISPKIAEVKRALEEACSWSASEREHRGESSRAFVIKNYSWSVISPLWEELYREI